MERRMLMAVVLSFFAVTAWSAATGGCQRPPPPKEEQANDAGSSNDGKPVDDGGEQDADDGEPDADDDAGTADAQDDDGGATDEASDDDGGATDEAADDDGSDDGGKKPDPAPNAKPVKKHPRADADVTFARLASQELDVRFTSRGAAVEAVRLRNIFESDGKTPMDLIVPADRNMLFGHIDTRYLTPKAAPGGADRKNVPAGPLRTLSWERDKAAEDATPDAEDVAFKITYKGVTYRKTWSLEAGEKRFGIRLALHAWAAGSKRKKVSVKVLASSGQLREVFRGAFPTPNSVMHFRSGEGEVDISGQYGTPLVKLPLEGIDPTKLRLLGARSTYFMTTYFADLPKGRSAPITSFWATGEQADLRPPMEARLRDWFADEREFERRADGKLSQDDMNDRIVEGVKQLLHTWMVVELPVSAEGPDDEKVVELDFYTGPIDREVLSQDAYEPLDPVITYPSAPDIVARFLLWIYDLWRGLLGSAGVAVILMTLVVRGGMMPLSIRNQLSMRSYGRKVAKLKPKLKALQEKYAKNPKRLREEQMKMYRENGVGFPSGCLMMLIQIPIFFALFSALRVEYSLRGESFLWIKDLAGPDRLVDFGGALFGEGMFRFDAINALPILMVVLSIWHTRSMPKPADEQQAQQMKMMKWMPIFFAVILYNYTAALALYMVFSSAIALIEAKIVRAKDEAASDAEAAPA